MSASVLGAIVTLGLAHIVARYAGPRWLWGTLKPLPIALLALALASASVPADGRYRWCIVAGLLCSLAGDVWLVFPERFVQGLASFFVAHVLYIAAFVPGGGWDARAWLLLVPLVAGAGGFLRFLWPHVRAERSAVVAYVGVITLMAWRAAARLPAVAAAGGALALAGALVFMVSDGLLATDRFARRFAGADALVMVTYYAAQTLIAASALA